MVAKGLPGRYAKFLTAAAGIGIVYAQNQFGASSQWVQLAVATAAALGVLAVPNTPAPPPPLTLGPSVFVPKPPGPTTFVPPAQTVPPPDLTPPVT